MTHYHVRIRGDDQPSPRKTGALALTSDAARAEAEIESASKQVPNRKATVEPCNEPCFGSRVQRQQP